MAARIDRALPHGLADALRQVALFAGAYWVYALVRGLADGRAATAFANARDLIELERGLHVFVEPSVQAWASGSRLLVDAASWVYVNAQSTVTIAALVWLYLFRNRAFYGVRNTMLVAMALDLAGYLAYPTAAPRFFPQRGFSDSVSQFTGVGADSVAVNALFNPYAAVPSMHVAFALMIGLPLARLAAHRAVRVAWLAYPVLVTFVVVVTANHFLVDAALGAATAGLAALLVRARPAWAFGRPRAGVAA